jgi:hypothetical protein
MMNVRLIRHLTLLLGLLAALASTPLRLVEAASDQSRTLAEADNDPSVETIDGGVGDDSDATIRVDPTGLSDLSPFAEPCFDHFVLDHRLSPIRAVEPPGDRPPRFAETLLERLATLQRYRN